MPSVYNTVFGGSPVAPAIPTYLSLVMSTNQVLGWPLESNITSPAAALIIDVNATAPALTVQLSDARQVGTGTSVLFNNVGANTFTVLDAQGNTLAAPLAGAAWLIYLADNSTLQGTWRTFQYGASVSSANAATLAGAGLKAISTTLNDRIFINAQAVNYTIGTGALQDRAACVEWTGGSGGTFTSSTAPVLGTDWFCYIKNSGTGVLTFTPGSGVVNGTASLTFNPNDSAILLTDGTNFFTVGFGQSVASSFNFVTISLAGASGTFVLSGAQLNRISYKFTGALAGNTVVQIPASIQQYWVDNETTGAFTLTISAGGAGSTFLVPQTTRVILYCDGLNVVNAVSAGTGGITLVADGTAAAPGLAWSSETDMGLYKAGVNTLAFSTAGTARGNINAVGQWTINAPSGGITFTVNGLSGTAEYFRFAGAGANGQYGTLFDTTNSVVRGYLGYGSSTITGATVADFGLAAGTAGRLLIGTATGGAIGTLFGPNGNVTINGPGSGNSLTVNGVAGGNALQLQPSAAGTSILSTDGTTQALLQHFSTKVQFGTLSNHEFDVITNNLARIQVSSTGNVTVNVPSSGTTLTVTGLQGSGTTALFQGPNTGVGWNIEWLDTTASAARGFIGVGTGTVGGAAVTDFGISTGVGGSVVIGNANGVAIATRFGPNGNVTINAPSSGVALTATAVAGNPAVTFNGVTGTAATLINGGGGSNNFGLHVVAGTSASDYSALFASSGGTTLVQIAGSGNVTINAPSSGKTLQVNVLDGGTALDFNSTTAVNGWFGTFSRAGTVTGYIGLGPTMFTGGALADFGIAAGAGALRFSVNAGATTHAEITSGGVLQAVDQGGTLQDVGWRDLPQNIQTSYTLALSDRGKSIYTVGGGGTWTIPANGSVAFPIGTTIVLVNASGSNQTLAITTDQLAWFQGGSVSTGSRTIAGSSVVTIYKQSATSWVLTGIGIS